jgi:transposase-like protein
MPTKPSEKYITNPSRHKARRASPRAAAQPLMRKLLMKSAKAPRVMITDKLKSYGAARKDMGLRIEHR